ncbi:unnamed protein product [Lactuca saligna]|uniref:Uncharacterized protein n=1 Tax=Lactuca saligna TaxID=75948 RepID=A0AA35VHF6_LACSI|nr:unnamed protein product [Lactuca saligna]
MENHILEKIKKRKLVFQKASSEDVAVPETPEAVISTHLLTPKQTPIIPLKVSLTISSHEEVRTSDIFTHVCDAVVNVTMGEGELNKAHPIITQGIIDNTTINTLVSLPPLIILAILVSYSPTFTHILNQPITSLFSSQSTNSPKPINNVEADDGGFGGTFDDL